jgi:methylenetetrahydrofolate dehydrogenase (NADP+)/methenyltetrahydrofolate cyclohydrolase
MRRGGGGHHAGPGGVGPMTIAMLMANTVIAAYRKAGLTPPKF